MHLTQWGEEVSVGGKWMYRKIVASLSIVVLLIIPGFASALGLGEIEIHSALNQPMDAEIELVGFQADEIDEVKVELASQRVFERVGIPRPYILTRLKFTPAVVAGKPVIRVTSTDSVREPFLTFLVDVRWSKGKLLREYTVLLDPPVFGEQARATVQKPTVAAPAPSVPKTTASAPPAPKPAPKAPVVVKKPTPIKPPAPKLKPAPPPSSIADSSPPDEEESEPAIKTRRGDTLWSIAERFAQSSGVSVNQMMLAIQEANPNGFTQDNINNLKAGVILRIPPAEAARRISRQEALTEVRRQWEIWQQGRQLADTADSAVSVDSGDAVPVEEADAPEAAATDTADKPADSKLSILGDDDVVEGMSGEDAEANADQLRKQIALLKERAESQTQENAELTDRIQSLESMLKKQEDIISLQNEQLAQLQNSVLSEDELSAEVPAEEEAVAQEDAASEEPVSDLQAEAEVASAPAEVAPAKVEPLPDFSGPIPEEFLAADTAAEEAAEPEQAPVEEEVPAEETVVAEDAASGSSFMESIMGFAKEQARNLLIAGGALIGIIAVWIGLRRRGERDQAGLVTAKGLPAFDDEDDAGDDVLEDTVIATPDRVDQALDELEEVEEEEDQIAAMDEGGQVDSDEVLEEADVYISYGLFQQAEDLLQEAIAKDPDNIDYQAKLAEVFHGDKRTDEFVAHVESIESKLDKGSPAWTKIATMGAALAPAHALFSDGAAADVAVDNDAASSMTTDLDIEEEIEDLVDDDLEDNSLDFTFGDDQDQQEAVDQGTEEIQAADASSAPRAALDTGLEEVLEAERTDEDQEDDLADQLEEAVDEVVESSNTEQIEDAGLDFDSTALEDELSVSSSADTEMLDESSEDDLDVENELVDMLDLNPEEGASDNTSIEPDLNMGADELEENKEAETAIFDSALFEAESVDSGASEEDTVSLEEVQENLTAELETLSFDSDDVVDPSDLEEASLPTLATEELSKKEIDDIDELSENLAASETGTFEADMLADSVTEQFDIGDIDTEMVDLGNFGDDDDLNPPSVIEEVGTKLDLAKAFVDMGDEDAAKETLTEVIESGNSTQIQEAKDLLDKLT